MIRLTKAVLETPSHLCYSPGVFELFYQEFPDYAVSEFDNVKDLFVEEIASIFDSKASEVWLNKLYDYS